YCRQRKAIGIMRDNEGQARNQGQKAADSGFFYRFRKVPGVYCQKPGKTYWRGVRSSFTTLPAGTPISMVNTLSAERLYCSEVMLPSVTAVNLTRWSPTSDNSSFWASGVRG